MQMKALRHDSEKPKTPSKRPFLLLGAAALLAVAPACLAPTVRGGAYYVNYMSSVTREYGGESLRRMRSGEATLDIMFLNKSIPALLAAGGPQKMLEDTDAGGNYGHLAVFENVILRTEYDPLGRLAGRGRGKVGMGFLINSDGTYQGVVAFPEEVDSLRGTAQAPGRRTVDAKAFADFYRSATGSQLRRVKLLAEDHGSCLTLHAVPADERGNPGGRFRGGYLAFGMTYFPESQVLRSGIGLLIEPGGRDPVNGAEGPY